MSEHDIADRQGLRHLVPQVWQASSASVAARAATDAPVGGVSCRLGDASCASAHATTLSRSASSQRPALQRSLLRLQRQYGNRYVGQVLRQAGVSAHGDCGMDAIERSIDQARGGGQAMDHGTRTQMEGAFGADFYRVRIHTDARADGLSQALSARAFATGGDLFFRQGEYNPSTSAGRELLAHVVQQNGDDVHRKMTVSEPGDPHEVEAEQMARAVMQREDAADSASGRSVLLMTKPLPGAPSVANNISQRDGEVYLQRDVEETEQITDQTNEQRDGGTDGYAEEIEQFTPDEGGEVDVDMFAEYVGDAADQGAAEQPDQMVVAPSSFVDLGRTGTASYGDPLVPDHHDFPLAFTDAGRTGTVAWSGGGGAGAHGNQATGSLQTNVPPTFFQTSSTADAWIREGTGKIDVTRSWTGVSGGNQGNGFFLTAGAATRINQHEMQHVANVRGHYNTVIDPLLNRVLNFTMDLATASAVRPPASPRSIPALTAIIQWPASVTQFQTRDTADNSPGGTVDTADLASGTYPVDAGPGTVAGTAYNHRIRTPAEPNPAP